MPFFIQWHVTTMAEGYLSLGISSALAKCCDSLGWKNPLPIQKSAIPPAIAGIVGK